MTPITEPKSRLLPFVARGALLLGSLVAVDVTVRTLMTEDGPSEPISIGEIPEARTSRPVATPAKKSERRPQKAQGAVQPVADPSPGSQPAPVAVGVRAIEVLSPLVELHLDEQGILEVPEDYAKAGWWTQGVAPGEPGAAVIVGHVDSENGPAIFHRVPELRPGDRIDVARVDGSQITFEVDAIQQFSKDDFPTETVYGGTDVPSLRLITCGGSFDEASRHYEDNVVVFASLVEPKRRVRS